MWKKILISLAVVVLLAVFGLWQLSAMFEFKPEPVGVAEPAALRTLAQGKLIGFADRENTHSWRGIPYAKPPVGVLRWRAPQPAAAWPGTLEALRFGAICPQIGSMTNGAARSDFGKTLGSEDCLTLNVWTPQFAAEAVPQADKRLPVMVWIHGGGNVNGSSSMYAFARNLAGRQNLVLVTVNYRLGIFGWFHHPDIDISESTPADRSGNYGTLDIIQALHWVKDNIAAFGGDPERVTVFGQSAGGANVYSLLESPLARGLFQRAIAESGSAQTVPLALTENYRDDPVPGDDRSAREIMNILLVTDGKAADRERAKAVQKGMDATQIRDYLYSKSMADLLATIAEPGNKMRITPAVFSDGTVLPQRDPLELFADSSSYNSVPFIAGTNRDETRVFSFMNPEFTKARLGFIPHIRDRAFFERAVRYGSDSWKARGADEPLTAMNAAGRNDVFGYRFDWDEFSDLYILDLSDMFGAAHGMEINFVFDALADNRLLSAFFYNKKSQPDRTQLTRAMASYWAEFAYTGNPGRGRRADLPEWKSWSNDADKYVILDGVSSGGIRMSRESMSMAQLKQRLLDDRSNGSIPTNKELCRWAAELFLYTHAPGNSFTQQEYASFGPEGCAEYPPEQFRPMRTL